MSVCRSLWIIGVLALVLASPNAHAQGHGGHGEFDRLVRSAVSHYEAHEARAAIGDLERAFAIRPLPRLLYNLGRAHEQAGDWAAAADYYQRFLESRPDPEALAITQEALEVARRHVADERDAAAQRQAAITHARELEIARQQAAAETLRRAGLNRARTGVTQQEGSRRVTTPIAALWTAGGVAALTAGVLGGLALHESSDFASVRQDGARSDLVTRGTDYAWGCNIAVGVAAVTTILGFVLYLLESPQADGAR